MNGIMKNEMKNSKDSNSAWHTIAARLNTFLALTSSIMAQNSANTTSRCLHHRSTGHLHRFTDIGYPRTDPTRLEMVTSVGGTSMVNSHLCTKFNRHSTKTRISQHSRRQHSTMMFDKFTGQDLLQDGWS